MPGESVDGVPTTTWVAPVPTISVVGDQTALPEMADDTASAAAWLSSTFKPAGFHSTTIWSSAVWPGTSLTTFGLTTTRTPPAGVLVGTGVNGAVAEGAGVAAGIGVAVPVIVTVGVIVAVAVTVGVGVQVASAGRSANCSTRWLFPSLDSRTSSSESATAVLRPRE